MRGRKSVNLPVVFCSTLIHGTCTLEFGGGDAFVGKCATTKVKDNSLGNNAVSAVGNHIHPPIVHLYFVGSEPLNLWLV